MRFTDRFGHIAVADDLVIITALAFLTHQTIDYFQSDKWAKVKQDIGVGVNWTKEKIQDAYHGITCQFLPDDAAQRIYLAVEEGSSDDNPLVAGLTIAANFLEPRPLKIFSVSLHLNDLITTP